MTIHDREPAGCDRRSFLTGLLTGAVALPTLAAFADLPAADEAAPIPPAPGGHTVRLGVIGCGGRGSWIADRFRRHGGYAIAAAADYFPEKTEAFGVQYEVPAERRFTGLGGYRRMLAAGVVDAVVIESPPYFHPEQVAAAVTAGVHVYLAKPVAVDVPGCAIVSDSARQATAKGLAFLVDFQTRAQPLYVEALRRVQAGALGDIVFSEAGYHGDNPFHQHLEALAAKPGDAEVRLRAWGLDRALSGDTIVEQFVHALDVGLWALGGRRPVAALGSGGLGARAKVGTCWDHFQVQYQFGGGVAMPFSGRQFKGHGTQDGIRNRVFGSRGVLEAEYGGQVLIRGEEFFKGGKTSTIYREGVDNNIAAFHRAIREKDGTNPTVAPSVLSTLVAILGRKAAYEARLVPWEELEKDSTRLVPDLSGLKD